MLATGFSPKEATPAALDQERAQSARQAIARTELRKKQLPNWNDHGYEQHLLKEIEVINKITGAFRMWTHPADWGDLAGKLGFTHRLRLGDMLYGANAGSNSNCLKGTSFYGAPLDFSDLGAWQHDMDYGRCSFTDRARTRKSTCGCRTMWADARLCQCCRWALPHAEGTTHSFLKQQHLFFNCEHRLEEFSQYAMHGPFREVGILAGVNRAIWADDTLVQGSFKSVIPATKLKFGKGDVTSMMTAEEMADAVKAQLYPNEKYPGNPELINRPAWLMIDSPKEYVGPMLEAAQNRHLTDMKALFPEKVAKALNDRWKTEYYSGLITFGKGLDNLEDNIQ